MTICPDRPAPIKAIKFSDFGDCGDSGDVIATSAVTPSGTVVSLYYRPDVGYWPILRNYFGNGCDRELDIYPTLAKAKAAILAD